MGLFDVSEQQMKYDCQKMVSSDLQHLMLACNENNSLLLVTIYLWIHS